MQKYPEQQRQEKQKIQRMSEEYVLPSTQAKEAVYLEREK